jgi:hypothetical protein
VADRQRAEEAVELYTRAGFEVRAVPAVPADFDDDCESCALVPTCTTSTTAWRRSSGRR